MRVDVARGAGQHGHRRRLHRLEVGGPGGIRADGQPGGGDRRGGRRGGGAAQEDAPMHVPPLVDFPHRGFLFVLACWPQA
jgi:hypothetical protein